MLTKKNRTLFLYLFIKYKISSFYVIEEDSICGMKFKLHYLTRSPLFLSWIPELCGN